MIGLGYLGSMGTVGGSRGIKFVTYDPSAQYAGGLLGLWYDPSDYPTLFQDNTTLPPVTGVTQPVGLMLDKRLGLALSTEIITNAADRTYSSDTGYWTKGTGTSIGGGFGTFSAAADGSGIYKLGFLTVGKYYECTVTVASISSGAITFAFLNSVSIGSFTAPGTYVRRILAVNTNFGVNNQGVTSATITNVSIKEVTGNHILQATAANRPIESARLNLLIKTEQFDDAAWVKQTGVTVTANQAIAPDSTMTADLIVGNNTAAGIYNVVQGTAGFANTKSVYLRTLSGTATVNLKDPSVVVGTTVCNLTTTWQRFSLSDAGNFSAPYVGGVYITDLPSAGIYAWGAQFEFGAVATRYQRVDTATSYDTVGFPQFQTFNGTNSGMATGAATFSANMDCFIAVRRATTASAVMAYASGSWYFGAMSTAGTAASNASAGTPTYAANGVVVAGGTGTTEAQLAAAVTVGAWVVLEVRNLDLSGVGWTSFQIGNYGGAYTLNGDIGGIILAPAGNATARQQNRRYLGNKVGLTLP